jgi:hypothetical protein
MFDDVAVFYVVLKGAPIYVLKDSAALPDFPLEAFKFFCPT